MSPTDDLTNEKRTLGYTIVRKIISDEQLQKFTNFIGLTVGQDIFDNNLDSDSFKQRKLINQERIKDLMLFLFLLTFFSFISHVFLTWE